MDGITPMGLFYDAQRDRVACMSYPMCAWLPPEMTDAAVALIAQIDATNKRIDEINAMIAEAQSDAEWLQWGASGG